MATRYGCRDVQRDRGNARTCLTKALASVSAVLVLAPIASASDIVSVAMQTGSEVFRELDGGELLTIEIERARACSCSTAC